MDFDINVPVKLDSEEAEAKLNELLKKDRKIKIGVELDKSAEMQAKDLAKSIEQGLKSTKIDTSSLAKQLTSGFNITDKNVINNIQRQINSLLDGIAKTWNGKSFDITKATGLTAGLDKMAQTISQNAKLVKEKTGIYDEFANYFKNKKIYVSDDLKSAMGKDLYKEISNANIGKIVRDATKGISIDSIWGEMTDLFPEHFSKNVTNQVDQIVSAFDVLKAARADVAKSINFSDMTSDQQFKVTDQAYADIVSSTNTMIKNLQSNINSASDAIKTEFNIDVKVNTDNIISDIKNALNQVNTSEPIKINLDINQNEIETQIRNAIQGISASDTPINIKLDVNKQSIEDDIRASLGDVDLPIQFKVDTVDLESQIRQAISAIDDVELDVHINTDTLSSEIRQQFDNNPVNVPIDVDDNAATTIANVNRAGQEGNTIFSALGGSVREAFQMFTLGNIMQDGIYKVIDAGKEGIEIVKSWDDAMLDLQMATGDSKAKVQEMVQSYNAMGQEIGALTTEVTSSADSFLRQGRSIEETNKLIKDSMVLSKVGQISSDQSSEILTATLNGFQMAADQAEHINDVLSSIDLASASSVEGIGTALTKTASMANNAGISLEKTAAMIATIKDVTQDSDSSIGNSINSILSRLNNVKAGKFVDSETGEALNDVEKVLGKIGISMRDANNQFLDSETIIDNVAAKWNTFDKTTQRAVATAMAGTRNYNKLVAMFDNYDKVQKLTAIANNSDGAAQNKFANYEQSLEAKTKSLQASLEALANDTLSSELYASFLDGAKGMADFAKETDLVKTALAGLGTAGATYAFTQLSTLLSNTLTQVSNLGGGLKGLWGVLSAHPVALVTTGVTAAVGAWNAYKASVQEAVNSAKEAGNKWEQSNTSLQNNIETITELRTALDSGTLTEQQAYEAKAQLLDIQNQLSESYGSQVQGIDLVTGSLDKQIAKIRELMDTESEQFLTENRDGIKTAKKEMTAKQQYELGQILSTSPEMKGIKEIVDKYTNQGLYGNEDNGVYTIKFEGDATQAESVLQSFATDVRAFQQEVGQSGATELILDRTSDALNDSKGILDEYQNMYKQAMKSDIQTDKTNYGGKTATEWLNNYSKAVENYNKAVSEGNAVEIDKAKSYYKAMDSSIQTLLSGSDMSKYKGLFTDVSDQLDTATIKAQEFNLALSGEGTNGYQKRLKSIVDKIKEMNLSDVDFKASVNSGDVEIISYLAQQAEQAGMSTDDLAQALVNLGVVSGQPASGLEETTNSIDSLVESSNTLISQINAVNSALSSQATGKSISLEDFNSDELKDYQSALEYVNGSMQLNEEKVRELTKAKADEAIATNDANKAQQQVKYMENIAQIEQLQDQLRSLNDTQDEQASTIQSSIDALLSENDTIVNQCNQLDILSASLREATGAYQNWLENQNGSESGDMFDDSLAAMEEIDNVTKNTDSEDYGRIGKNSYKAAVEFVIPESIDSQDAEAVQSYLNSIDNYFKHDENGNRTGLDVAEFCQKAVDQGLMTLDEASGQYQIAGERTMQDFADGLGLALPLVQAMFGEMEEYGGSFSWGDEAIKTLGDLGMAAGEAKERIEGLSGNEGMNIQIDVSDIENTEDKISTLEGTISQMQEYKGTLEVDSSQVDDANAVIQYCIMQKQVLESPAVMSVDTSQVNGELGNALSLLQQFQTAQNNVELQTSVGADTSEAQSKVDGLVSEIQGLSPEIQAKLGIDATSEATIQASVKALTPEIMVKAGVDSKLVESWANQKKTSKGTVTWNNNTGAVDAWASQVHRSNGTVTWTNNINLVRTHFTAEGTVHWTNTTAPTSGGSKTSSGSSGVHGLNGTAHMDGTAHYPHLAGYAHAKGNWGTKSSGMALVGELGREIVVEPNGYWHSVGDNGAEFQYIPAGSVIFNHLQTEALLERGFVNSRGTAYMSGTAFVTGGISKNQANIASGKTTYRGSSTTTKTTTTKTTTTKDTTSNDTSSDDEKSKIDWIEKALDRINQRINRIKTNVSNIYRSFADRRKSLKSELSYTQKELDAQEKAYKKYLKYADNVELSDSIKKKVRHGSYSIGEYDKDTQKLIQEYEDYYKKALDCKDATYELKNSLAELAREKFDMVIQEWTDKLMDFEHVAERTNSLIERRSEYASEYLTSDKSITASRQNISDYQSLIQNAKSQQNVIVGERDALKQELANLTADKNSGITKGSQGYNEMVKEIQDLENQYDELGADIISYSNSISEEYKNMFDTVSQDYENKLDMAEHLATEYNNALELAEAKGLITTTGYYEQMQKIEQEKLNTYNQQAEAMNKALYEAIASGEIEVGSQAYYDMRNSINQVTEAAQEAEKQITELNNSIRQVKWDQFDYTRDRVADLNDEIEFMISLMKDAKLVDDKGLFTDEGLATIGMYGTEYNTLMSEADEYAAEIKRINAEIANDPYDTKLIERKNQLLQKQRELIQSANDQKQAIKDLVEDGIKAQLDSLKELISTYTDALDRQKDLYDYQKKISEQTKNINKLQKELSAYDNDLSEETKAKVQQIKVELEEARANLEETQYDNYISQQKQILDDLYDEYEKALNERLDNLDLLMEEMIATANASAVTINDTLVSTAESVGYTMSDSLNSIWGSAQSTMLDNTQTLLNELVNNGKISRENADSIIKALGSGSADQIAKAQEVVDNLIANGSLATSDAGLIRDTITNQTSDASVLAMYGRNFNEKQTTTNNALSAIKEYVGSLVAEAERQAIEAQQKIEQEQADREKQDQQAQEEGKNNGTKNEASNAVNGNLPTTDKDNAGKVEGKEPVTPTPTPAPKPTTPTTKPSTSKSTQGDGKIQVGDKVKFNSGSYYYSSDGVSPVGSDYHGKQVYITSINKASWATKPYHISTGKKLGSGDLGWVTKSQISGYARGAKRIGSEGLAWTNENWDTYGAENIVRKSDHAVLTRVGADDRIYNAMASENIWQFANNPMDFINKSMDELRQTSNMVRGGNIENHFSLDNVTFNMPGVTNYKEFMQELQHDNNFERFVQSMTIDAIAGKGTKGKYKINFK